MLVSFFHGEDKMFGKSSETTPKQPASEFSSDLLFNAAGQIVGPLDPNVRQTQGGYGQLQGIQTMDACGNWVYSETITVNNS